jgi:hypothetical protein
MPAEQTILVRGAHDADYFQNEMFPDKIATTGHFVVIAEDSGVPFCNWTSRMPIAYIDNNIKIVVDWVSVNVTSGVVVWDVEVERLAPGGNPLNASNFDTAQTDLATVSGVLSAISRAEIVFTKAQFDDIAAGDDFRLRLTRDTSSGSDTLIGDAMILNWSLESNV